MIGLEFRRVSSKVIPFCWFLFWRELSHVSWQVLVRILGRMTHMTVAVAWDTWRYKASKQRQLTGIAGKGVRRMFSRTLALALGRWQESAVELRRQRKVTACVFCFLS